MVYFLRSPRTGLIKIGRTSFFRSRYARLCRDYDETLEVMGVVSEDDWEERALHRVFRSIRVVNEWFEDSPGLRRFIAEHATLDHHGIDSPRNETLAPIDRDIARKAKRIAAERGIKLNEYLDSLLRDAVDRDAGLARRRVGELRPARLDDRVAIVADVPEPARPALVGAQRVHPLRRLPTLLARPVHRLNRQVGAGPRHVLHFLAFLHFAPFFRFFVPRPEPEAPRADSPTDSKYRA